MIANGLRAGRPEQCSLRAPEQPRPDPVGAVRRTRPRVRRARVLREESAPRPGGTPDEGSRRRRGTEETATPRLGSCPADPRVSVESHARTGTFFGSRRACSGRSFRRGGIHVSGTTSPRLNEKWSNSAVGTRAYKRSPRARVYRRSANHQELFLGSSSELASSHREGLLGLLVYPALPHRTRRANARSRHDRCLAPRF